MESNEQQAVNTTVKSIIANFSLAIVKGLGGYFGNSYALIADAIESTSDVFASILVLLGIKYSNKPADSNHPYGHGRAEPLITFLVVGFLVASATIIAIQSIHNIRTPHDLPRPYTLIILGAIIVVKELFYRMVVKKGQLLNSSSLKADAWHHRSDAITSLAAFIGIAIALFLGKGYETADDWAALVAALVILYNGYLIFRPALGEIMDENFYDELIDQIRQVSLTVNDVKGTEKCYVRKAGMKFHVDLHVKISGDLTVTKGHTIAHELKATLKKEISSLAEILIHIEPAE